MENTRERERERAITKKGENQQTWKQEDDEIREEEQKRRRATKDWKKRSETKRRADILRFRGIGPSLCVVCMPEWVPQIPPKPTREKKRRETNTRDVDDTERIAIIRWKTYL